MERRDRLSRVAEVAIWPEGRESRAKEAKGERLPTDIRPLGQQPPRAAKCKAFYHGWYPKKYIKIPSQLTRFTQFTLFTLLAQLSAYNAYNALWNNGSYVIQDFGTLPTIFSTSKYFRWQFQPCPSLPPLARVPSPRNEGEGRKRLVPPTP